MIRAFTHLPIHFLVSSLFLTSTVSVYGAAEAPDVTWASSQVELAAEFCPTSWPLTSDRCTAPNRPTAIFKFPQALGSIVERHLQQASQSGYYQELSLNDFFHGHLILKGPQSTFDSPKSFFDDVSVVLYHTAEYNNRWENQASSGVPAQQRTPRSLLGFRDGRLQPATDFIHDLPQSYENSGTLYGSDVVKALPDMSSLPYGDFGGVPDVFVNTMGPSGPTLCQADSLEFYILYRADGRFHAPDGKPIEIFVRCVQNPDRSSIGYVTIPRL